jgi:hypothetical protein
MSTQPAVTHYITHYIYPLIQPILQYLVTPFNEMSTDPDASAAGSQGDGTANASPESPAYQPSIADVLVTKAMLTKSLSVPPEIIDTIVDLAEYWPHTTTEAIFGEDYVAARGNNIYMQGSGQENGFLVS